MEEFKIIKLVKKLPLRPSKLERIRHMAVDEGENPKVKVNAMASIVSNYATLAEI